MKCFITDSKNNLLLQTDAAGDFRIPSDVPVTWPHADHVYDMTAWILMSDLMQDDDSDALCAFSCDDAPVLPEGFIWMSLRETWNVLSEREYRMACHAAVWNHWDRTSRFCGVCGGTLSRHQSMGKRCGQCGAEHFPHIAPAVIVRISRGDEVLLVHARNFRRPDMYGLVAGFVEGGETLEACVAREVREETGIEVTDLRYFGSQAWPYPSGLMIGFTARYVSGTLRLQDAELSDAGFFDRNHLPELPGQMSIARRLIDDFFNLSEEP